MSFYDYYIEICFTFSASVMFQYFVKIVPTMYVKVNNKVSDVNFIWVQVIY